MLSDANDIGCNDAVELKAEKVKEDEPECSRDQSLLSTHSINQDIAEKSTGKEDVILVEAELDATTAEEVIKDDGLMKDNAELANLPTARICNFLMSSDDSESNNVDDVVELAELPKARLTDIDADTDHLTATVDRSTEQNVCLIDETVMSSDSDNDAEPRVLLTSEENMSEEDSNILDQNVNMDDTCLDESALSGTQQLDNAIDNDQSLDVSNKSSGNVE